MPPERDPTEVMVYFMDRNDGRDIRIGKGDDRPRQHRLNGYTFLAGMPGGKPLEDALHHAFEPFLRPYGGSHYPAEILLPYIEELLRQGYATDREEDVPYVTRVPIHVVLPTALLKPAAANEPQSVLPGLRLDPLTDPKERLARAAACSLHSSNSDEWYTPLDVIEAARATLGAIDLDPASNWKANRRVGATHYYSERVNGLSPNHQWSGRVWMNPPYGDRGPQFAQRLVDEYSAEKVTAACALFAVTCLSAMWFAPVYDTCGAIGVTRGRVQFDVGREGQTNGERHSAPSGHVVVYLGPDVHAFEEAFGQLCTVYFPKGKQR